MKRFLLAFLTGLVLAGLLVVTIQKGTSTTKQGSKRGGKALAVAVETAQLKIGSLVDEGRFSGSIEAASKFMVAPKISGRIKKLFVEIGDTIQNGATIATLDDEELLLAVKQANADLEIARANYNESASLLTISQRELDRVKTMRQQKVSSEVEVENAQAAYKTREARHQVNKALVTQKEAAFETSKLKLAYATVDASWSGGGGQRFVAERFQNAGAMIGANTPIVSVIDIATVTAVIDVVERDYFKIKQGLKAEIEPAAMPGEIYQATVSRITPMLDETSRQARIELELQNKNYSLKPGMFIKATIIYEVHNSTTIAPAGALVRCNEQEGLFLIDTEKSVANFVPVTTGFREGEFIEIASPSISGEVVTLGHHLLEDGAGIIINGKNLPGTSTEKGKGAEKKAGRKGGQQK
ncbi:MAG: efflux RND transporter periplasmic adaptor subunit [Candidatus Riflebacteria bacterium]|nr:efflux RND transporter periplasmic adaptor subunit [Candidatus Riflebacteria bacterium]